MSSAEISEHEPHTASSQPTLPKRSVEPEQPKGSPVRTIVVVLIVLAIVGAAVWKIRSNTESQATQGQRQRGGGGTGPTPVTVAAVQQKTMPIYLTALGTVTAYNTVTIKTRVDGQLVQVPVREGQAVKAGQLLAEIDPSPYQAALAQAQGQLTKDQATNDYARVEAQRYQDLYAAGVVSKDSAQTQASSAGQSAGAIAADQAAIQAAKVNLAYTKISSPIDGVVGLRQVDPGNIVHASDATGLLVVTQLHPIAVIFTLPEDELPQVQQVMRGSGNLAVEAYDRSNSTHIASGKLLTLDNQIDTTTGMVKAKAVFDNRDNALFPNQFVNVRLILQDRPNALVVPAAAIQSGAQGHFVFAVRAGLPPASDSDSADGAAGGSGGGGAGGGGARRARGTGSAAGGTGAAGAAPAMHKADREVVRMLHPSTSKRRR